MNNKEKIRLKLYARYLLSKPTDFYKKYDNNKQNIVVTLAADYGNLGDVAITYAQTEFLQKKYPNANIIDFPISQTFTNMKSLKRIIKDRDIITIVGGGNTGDMYDDIEYCRQFVIKSFPNNKIISFPQTIDFSDTSYGKKALEKAQKAYGNHSNLTLSAREEKSYQKYKNEFTNNKVVKTPDIVLSLGDELADLERNGIMFCLRSDKEKNIDKELESQLITSVREKYEVTFRDTHVDKNNMSVDVREKELHKIWDQFKGSELVITDRLHGMIFSVITGTPCLAIDNHNKKVSGVYNAWLKDLSYIKTIDKQEEAEKLVEEMINQKSNQKNSNTVEADAFEALF